jgi:4-alpha-glucanotransferase
MPLPQVVFEPSTNYEDALHKAAGEWGIEREFWDIFGKKHVASAAMEGRILAALGLNTASQATLEDERIRRFQMRAAPVIQPVSITSETEKWFILSLAEQHPWNEIRVEVITESSQRLTITHALNQLKFVGEWRQGDKRWFACLVPLPPEVPLGYHALKLQFDELHMGEGRLIVTPDRAYLPPRLAGDGKCAGVAITLYGLRSGRNWGCGDFTDLHKIVDWVADDLAGAFVGLNPLHALHNRFPYNQSPYLPLSIFYKNLLYIDIEGIPEFVAGSFAQRLFSGLRVQQEIHALRASEFVEYERVDKLKKTFLKCLYLQFERGASAERKARFEAFSNREGLLLDRFALYCALDEVLHKQDRTRWTWRDWPADYHDPASDACARFAAQHSRLIRYFKYIQFVLEEQLAAVHDYARKRLSIGLYHDLALATDRFGSDLWAHSSFYVQGCRVGAPPDAFSPGGQDWAFPPPNAEAHRMNGYELFHQSIRKIVRFGGALRIDHVMRLFHLFWIPDGVKAANGVYVKDNHADLLRILALESVQEQNIIVGEDLGTVTDEIRAALDKIGSLSYRLFYFEKRPDGAFKRTSEYPRNALVASTTHDLPTIAGFWIGRDIEARRAAGLASPTAFQNQSKERQLDKQRMLDVLHQEQLLPEDYTRDAAQVPALDGPLHNAIIGFLAQTPSALLLLNQEDLTKETEQQNLPGSTAQYPNWRRKMRWTVEELRELKEARDFGQMFRHQLERTGRAK